MTELQAQFVAEARAVHVEVFEEASPAAVRERVAGLIREQRLLAWDAARLPYDVARIIPEATLLPADSPTEHKATATVGLTGCDGAIAQTGALVLGSRKGSPRSASLLPDLHVAVVRPDQLVPDLAAALEASAELLTECSMLNLVAGPSRTADIELTLTLGVHGPRRVAVVIGP